MTLEERKNRYRKLCSDKKITSLFLQPWWLDAAGPWDVSFAYRNDQLVGALPFGTGRKWGVSYIGLPLLTHHMKIWMEKPADISDHKWLTREKQIIWSIIDHLPPHGFFSMVFAEDSFDNWLPFHWKNFRQEMRYTFVVDRAHFDSEALLLNRNMKRNIKTAESELVVREATDNTAFFNLCKKTYSRQKKNIPYTYDAFSQLDKAITENKAGIKLEAHKNETVVGVSYMLWDTDTAYYFLAGDNEAGRESSAGILLCYEAMRIAFDEKRLERFDFCGSMIEPITEIRRQFGARSEPLMKIFKANHRWLDILYQLTH